MWMYFIYTLLYNLPRVTKVLYKKSISIKNIEHKTS